MRVKRGETYLLAEALDQLPGVLACETTTAGGDQQRAAWASGSSLVDRVRDRGVQRSDGGLRALPLTLQVQHAVAPLLTEILDIGVYGLRYPQAELQQEQHEQCFARTLRARRSDQAPGTLLACPCSRGLVGDLGTIGELDGVFGR